MKFAIVSDSHDNLANIDKMLDYLKQNQIKVMIHCGDVCAPAVLAAMAKKFQGNIHLVFGNVDTDQEELEKLPNDFKNIKIYGETGQTEIDKKTIAWTHYPWQAQELAESGKYNLVFYGHDHQPWEKLVGQTKMLNPGTLAGMFSKPTFAIYDTATDKAQLILLEKI